MKTYPSPEQIFDLHAGQKVFFGFDFDGTLVSLAERPEAVELSSSVKNHLIAVARNHRVVMCTGRSVPDLQKFLPPIECAGLDVVGNHGSEWFVQGDHRVRVKDSWWHWREEMLPRLSAEASRHGGEIEDKKESLTIHFRLSGRDFWTSSEAITWLKSLPRNEANLVGGKEAWNLVPFGFSKGEALVAYGREFSFETLIYFGDEPTDETVFERTDFRVIGFKVGEGPTQARYRVPDVTAVREWLRQLSMVDKGFM